MDEETLRKMALEQYLQGKDPVSIYKELGRTKPWFFKWLHRYQPGDEEWFKDHSRSPHTHPGGTPLDLQQLVTNVRIQLEENPFAQVGVSAIKWECNKLGVRPPSDCTINRILKRAGLLKKNSLPTQRSGILLFSRSSGVQQHPSSRPFRPSVHQKRWPILFASHHGSLQSSNLYPLSATERRRNRSHGLDPLLENHGDPRLPPSRQRTLLSGKQSVSPFLRPCSSPLPFLGNRSRLHPHGRTLAEWNRGELQ